MKRLANNWVPLGNGMMATIPVVVSANRDYDWPYIRIKGKKNNVFVRWGRGSGNLTIVAIEDEQSD